MEKFNVQLKKISFNERMSEETNCFVADLYINGKKVGYCKNDGRGGCTDYHGDSKECNEIIRTAEDYFKSLPKVKAEGYNFMYQPTLETAIDEQFELYLKAKGEKKMQKLFLTAIVWGIPNSGRYTMLKYKAPLADLAKMNPKKMQETVNNIKTAYCVGDVVILNKNLAALGITI